MSQYYSGNASCLGATLGSLPFERCNLCNAARAQKIHDVAYYIASVAAEEGKK